jgi:hypothetical protein
MRQRASVLASRASMRKSLAPAPGSSWVMKPPVSSSEMKTVLP